MKRYFLLLTLGLFGCGGEGPVERLPPETHFRAHLEAPLHFGYVELVETCSLSRDPYAFEGDPERVWSIYRLRTTISCESNDYVRATEVPCLVDPVGRERLFASMTHHPPELERFGDDRELGVVMALPFRWDIDYLDEHKYRSTEHILQRALAKDCAYGPDVSNLGAGAWPIVVLDNEVCMTTAVGDQVSSVDKCWPRPHFEANFGRGPAVEYPLTQLETEEWADFDRKMVFESPGVFCDTKNDANCVVDPEDLWPVDDTVYVNCEADNSCDAGWGGGDPDEG